MERLSPSKVKVWVEAPDFDAPPTLMHQLYPGEFTDELELTHGEAFAVIHARKARRYVYLGQDPSAEELTLR